MPSRKDEKDRIDPGRQTMTVSSLPKTSSEQSHKVETIPEGSSSMEPDFGNDVHHRGSPARSARVLYRIPDDAARLDDLCQAHALVSLMITARAWKPLLRRQMPGWYRQDHLPKRLHRPSHRNHRVSSPRHRRRRIILCHGFQMCLQEAIKPSLLSRRSRGGRPPCLKRTLR